MRIMDSGWRGRLRFQSEILGWGDWAEAWIEGGSTAVGELRALCT
jgi:hypothetical protein